MAHDPLSPATRAVLRQAYVSCRPIPPPGGRLRIGRSLWYLLLVYEAGLATVLFVALLFVATSGTKGTPFRDVLGTALVIAAGAAFLLALVLAPSASHLAAISTKTLYATVPGKPPLVLAADAPEVTNRRREEPALRRDEAVLAGLMGFVFLGLAVLLVIDLWLCLAALVAGVGCLAYVLSTSRPAPAA